jgi:pimeloyl-ACP methyl ester carboxylesterase
MRRLFSASLALLLGITVLSPSLAWAQKGGERVKFQTCDGVELRGTFYPGKGPKSTCILLLHQVGNKNSTQSDSGGNTQQDGWDRLATKLNADGNAVLSFDFRGHGDSLSVDKETFWKAPHNGQILIGKPRDTIEFKEFPKNYLPQLTNDISAAKTFLDRRNDEGQCNSSNMILIGAQDGAALGAMWLAAEMYRYKIVSQLPLRLERIPESQAVKACIWISMSQPSFWQPFGDWLKAETKRVPMVFVYGSDDPGPAPNFARRWVEELNRGNKSGKKVAFLESIKKTKLAGHQLLRKDLNTVDRIAELLADFAKNVTLDDYAKVEFEKKGFMWNFGGRTVPGKQPEDKFLLAQPVSSILLPPRN